MPLRFSKSACGLPQTSTRPIESLRTLNFNTEETRLVIDTISICILLQEIQYNEKFSEKNNFTQVIIDEEKCDAIIHKISKKIRVEVDEDSENYPPLAPKNLQLFIESKITLKRILTFREARGGRGRYLIPLSKVEAESQVALLVKYLYEKLFDWVIEKIYCLLGGNKVYKV